MGPSGCGKTHLIKHLGMLSISNGYTPIFVAAKYFLGKLSDLLDRSIAHLYTGKALELLKTVSAAGRQPFLILDGLNECHPKLLSTLIENLQAFALRKECPIVTTSQTEIVFLTESKGPIVRMYHLKPSEKPGILAAYLSEPPPIFAEILELLKTPLEICLAVESSRELEKNVTKYELFNSYTRKCLARSENSSLTFRTLVKIGKIMGERLLTTLLQSEFNRIAELAALPPKIADRMFRICNFVAFITLAGMSSYFNPIR